MNRRGFAVCLTVSILLVVWFVPICFAVDDIEASSAIIEAERDLGSAYALVAEAEGSGANVSVLLRRLGSAGDFLSEAYFAFRAGDYGNASLLTIECKHVIEGVAGEATDLKAEAEKTYSNSVLLTASGSAVGLVLLLLLGFFGWKFLKRRYFRRVLNMKPQVEGSR